MDFLIKKFGIAGLISSALIITLCIAALIYTTEQKKTLVVTKTTESNQALPLKDILTTKELARGATSSHEEKIQAVQKLKKISLDESYPKHLRQLSGEIVTSTFFSSGMTLSEGFLTKEASPEDIESEVYKYSKYVNTLGDGPLNPLLTAYIGLRFYPEEQNKEIIAELLNSSIRFTNSSKNYQICPVLSKRASVIYLASKNKKTDVTSQFGDYYSNFEKAFIACKDQKNSLIAFMWLAALSDVGTSTKEHNKANELIEIITKDTTTENPLVVNLRNSYFTKPQEPDTESIVKRLRSKYPKFDLFIKNIQ